MRTVKVIDKEIDEAYQEFIKHQNSCKICQHKPQTAEEEMECFLAEDLYDTYENLRSEKDYAEQVFQQELIDRNINLKSNTMNYQIIETHIIYENGKLKEVAVLWADGEYVRATYITNQPISGYSFIMPNDRLSDELLQKAAAGGRYVDEKRKKKYFGGRRNWSR